MVQIIVFIPRDHKEAVKQAMFDAGAGAIGNYDSCSFEVEGTGQFRPLKNSNAFIGSEGVLERVPEVKVEMCCLKEKLKAVISAMIQVHPYETPAYYVIDTLKI